MNDEQARALFDAVRYSDDLRHLDDEATAALRELAAQIGEDPNEATPDRLKARYPHAYVELTDPVKVDAVFGIQRVVAVKGPDGWTTVRSDERAPYAPCAVWQCGKPEDDAIHQMGG